MELCELNKEGLRVLPDTENIYGSISSPLRGWKTWQAVLMSTRFARASEGLILCFSIKGWNMALTSGIVWVNETGLSSFFKL